MDKTIPVSGLDCDVKVRQSMALRCTVKAPEGCGWPDDIRLSFGHEDFWKVDLQPYEGREAAVLYGADTVGVARVSGGVIEVVLDPPMIGRPIKLTCNLLAG